MIDPNDAETLDPDDFDTIQRSSNTVEPDDQKALEADAKVRPYAGHELDEPFDPDETIDLTETVRIMDAPDPNETWEEEPNE